MGHSSQDSQSHVPYAIKNFTISQKEKTLKDLMRDRWLCSTSNGGIGIGVRSFLDLRSFFRSNDVPSCDVCNEAGVKGHGHSEIISLQGDAKFCDLLGGCILEFNGSRKCGRMAETCQNQSCNIRIHEYCLKKKFSQKKVSRVCPGCGTAWPFSESDKEGDEETNDPTQNQVPSSGCAQRKKLRSCKAEAVETAQDQSQVPSEGPALRRRPRTCKAEAAEAAEAVETAQDQSQVPSEGPALRRRPRTCKAEAAASAEPGPSRDSKPPEPRKTRRSRLMD